MHNQFNELAAEFLDKMEQLFPYENKIKVFTMKFDMTRRVNSKQPVYMFMQSMIPFGDKIITRDEQFFKKDNLVTKAESISGKIGLIDYWDSLSEDIKNMIWEYIQGLYVLGHAVIETEKKNQT